MKGNVAHPSAIGLHGASKVLGGCSTSLAEYVNDFETPARQIYCRVVAAVFGLGVDFQVG